MKQIIMRRRRRLVMKNTIYILFALIVIFTLSGCADTVTMPVDNYNHELVGFWYGLWHGMTASIAFIGHLFNPDIAIYAKYNNGSWYDFGFLLGVGAFAGGCSESTRKRDDSD
jgi:hypothetical protein